MYLPQIFDFGSDSGIKRSVGRQDGPRQAARAKEISRTNLEHGPVAVGGGKGRILNKINSLSFSQTKYCHREGIDGVSCSMGEGFWKKGSDGLLAYVSANDE